MRTKAFWENLLRKIHGSERNQGVEVLRESDALLRVIFDQSSLLMGIMKPDGTVLKINPKAYSFIGSKETEVIGKPFWETPWWTHSPELQERLREAIKVAASGECVRFETDQSARGGRLYCIDFSITPVKDEKGNVVLLLPEGRDITERKLAEQALREAAVKYRVVADNTFNWEFWMSPEGRFIYTSPSCQRISGHEAAEFEADPGLMSRIIHADDRKLWTDHRHDIIRSKTQGEVVFRIIRPDGEIRWLHHICLPVCDDNGNYLGTRGGFSDITIRKQAEDKNFRLAAIVEASDDAIIGKLVDGTITSWNRGAEKIFGYSESEVLGKPVTILVPAEYRDEVLRINERVKRGEHIEHFETVGRRKNGDSIYLSLTYSPIRDREGRVVAVSSIGRDITEHIKAAHALLDNTRIKRELEIAKEIQQSLLRECPWKLSGMLTACRCVPATHVGGDYYDFFSVEPHIVDVVIADVTGHSVGSAILMAMTRSVLHAKVSAGRSPGQLLAEVNDLLYDDLSRAELQMSMFCARFDTENHSVAFANAGHNPPLLFRSGEGAFMELDADGLLMGVKTGVRFEEKATPVESGDILTLYTDGVTEAENAAGEPFGTGRLREVIAKQCEAHPREIMAEIFQGLSSFTGSKSLADDVAMIMFKML